VAMDTEGNDGNRRTTVPGSPVDPALYQNLVDMIPLVETFLERQGGGGGTTFAHHAAPMVYTRAPSRGGNGFIRKSFESPGKFKRSLNQQQRTPAERCLEMEEGDLHSPVWEEGHNILRRVEETEPSPYHLRREIEELKQQLCEKDTLLQSYGQQQHLLPRDTTTGKLQEIEELKQKLKERDSFLETLVTKNSKESCQLQSELEELKQKVWEKEQVLENTVKHTSAEIAASRVARDRDVLRLQTQVGELQQEVWEKKQSAQSVQIQLSEKQLELEKMQSLLDRKEIDMARTNYQAASIEAEVIGLQCQLLALQSQLNAAVDTSTYADGNHHTQIAGVQNDQSLLHEMSEQSKENMELARHKYLAAVVAAREVSGDKEEEPLVLVAELRKNLQAFLRKPSSLLEACGCDMGSPL
jgi:hypothetical protein